MIDVIDDNNHFIVINKPAGVEFHGDDGILQILRKQLYSEEIYGVHRLDKGTSGVMIFAKSKQGQTEISKLFEKKKINKIYISINLGRPHKKQGLIKGDLVKSRNGSYKLSRSIKNPSLTKLSSFLIKDKIRGFILKPLTGKTHQLRVVSKSLGSPILGDMRYGKNESDRMYLHCYAIRFHYKGVDYFYDSYPKDGKFFTEHKALFLDNLSKN